MDGQPQDVRILNGPRAQIQTLRLRLQSQQLVFVRAAKNKDSAFPSSKQLAIRVMSSSGVNS
jgi:hypothetical protein